jgi:hypothetical protein
MRKAALAAAAELLVAEVAQQGPEVVQRLEVREQRQVLETLERRLE